MDVQQALSEDQQRLKLHLSNLNIYDLQRLRECFEYEFSIESDNRPRIQEILDFIAVVIKDKLTLTG